MQEGQENWSLIIKPRNKWYELNLKDIWRYRDLLWLFVRRDFVATYKQTILGPIWFFVEPVLTALIYTLIFGGIANTAPDSLPKVLFFLSGVTAWKYFADCFTKTSGTFTANAHIFGKVYFPRMIIPISTVFSSMIKFGIQIMLFLVFWVYFLIDPETVFTPNWEYILLMPVLVMIMAGLGLAFGMFVSSLTTKYRDFQHLVGFGVQLLMFASPVVYPMEKVKELAASGGIPVWLEYAVELNPMTSIIETFKYAFLGEGVFSWYGLLYSFGFMVVMLIISSLFFNKVEKSFVDTV